MVVPSGLPERRVPFRRAAVDPDDETRRVLVSQATNCAVMPDTLAYELVDDEGLGCARVRWLGTSPHTSGSFLAFTHDDHQRAQQKPSARWFATIQRCCYCFHVGPAVVAWALTPQTVTAEPSHRTGSEQTRT